MATNFDMTDFRTLFTRCINELENLGYNIYNRDVTYKLEFSNKATKWLGRTIIRRKNGHRYFTIQLNKIYCDTVNLKDILNTIMHECCHTIDGGDTHTGEWLKAAKAVNKAYGYNIERLADSTEIAEYLNAYNALKPNRYGVVCGDCGAKTEYQRITKAYKAINLNGINSGYYCARCKSKNLKAINLV